MRRETAWVLLSLLTVGAFTLRVWVGSETLSGANYRPFTDDGPYHLMRVEALVSGSVDRDAPDPALSWPRGAKAHWPWGFDDLLAVWARGLGASDAAAAARAAAWVPPAFGALLVPLTYLLAAAWTGRRRALWAAAVVAFLPAHIGYTLLGRVDHHVLEPVFLVLSLLGPGAVLSGALPGRTAGAAASGMSGLVLGLAFAFHPAALPWAMLGMAVAGIPLALRAPGSAVAFAGAAFAGTVASLGASPWPDAWVFYSPSRMQLAVVGVTAIGLVVASVTRSRGRSPWGALFAGSIAAAAAFAALIAVASGFRTSLAEGISYLASGSFTALSLEARPLFEDPVRTARLVTAVAPLALAGATARILGAPCPWKPVSNSGDPRTRTDLWLGWAILGAIVLAAAQRRFLVAATPLLALGMVEGLQVLGGIVERWLGKAGVSHRLAWSLVGAMTLAGAMPGIHHLLELDPLTATDRAMYRAAATIRARIGGDRERGRGRPSHGALVPWSHGHLFQWAAGVGTVCDNFFGEPESDRALIDCLAMLYEDDPRRITGMLEAFQVDFVVLVPPHPERTRVYARLLGRFAAEYVDDAGRFLPAFAGTFQAVAGFWGATARPGDTGPFGLVLLDRFDELDAEGEIAAQVLLFLVPRQAAMPRPESRRPAGAV